MNDTERNNKKSRINGWLLVGVLVLIALLLIWLTVADLFGDTDVVASVGGAGDIASRLMAMLMA